MPEDHLHRSMLLDYYGDLLTARQRECYELHYNEDLSLSEIAEQCGISRQGVWDNIRRASDTMEKLEEKTGLIRRQRNTISRLQTVAARLASLEERLEKRGDLSGDQEVSELLRQLREEVGAMLKTEE